jgi:DNA modification methylase
MEHKLEIIYKQENDLIPYQNNTRTHSKEQIEQLKSSIKEFGMCTPIGVHNQTIVYGHARFESLKQLGYTEFPTVDLSHLSEAQLKAYIIADNRLSLDAGWDEELLKVEIEALKDMDFDIDLLGFSIDELDDLGIGDVDLDLDSDKADEVPELEENPVIKLGDLIELGHNYQHRLLCGSSTEDKDVEKLMDGVKSEMVFTDPPYLMDFTGGVHADGSKSFNAKHGAIKNDKMSKEDGNKFLDDVNSMIQKWNKGAFYITFYRLGIGQYFSSMERVGLQNRALIIWNKGNHTLSNSDYMSRYEPIFYGWVKDHNFYGGKNGMDIWDIKRTSKNDLHPTMKPVELVEKAVFEGSKTKQIVLDLFGGSGTTLIACENLSRHSRLMELDEKYAQVIIQRYVDYTSNPMIKINGKEVDWHEYKESNSNS